MLKRSVDLTSISHVIYARVVNTGFCVNLIKLSCIFEYAVLFLKQGVYKIC